MSGTFVNLDHFKGKINYLLAYRSEEIERLPKNVKKEFDSFRKEFETIRYSDLYTTIHGWILKQLPGSDKKGTIGSYFKECRDDPCSKECGDSLALPHTSTDYNLCSSLIIFAIPSEEGYKFHLANCVQGDAIIHFPSDHNFTGFSPDEIRELRGLIGERKCKVSDIDLKDIPLRKVETSQYTPFVIFLAIVFIGVVTLNR